MHDPHNSILLCSFPSTSKCFARERIAHISTDRKAFHMSIFVDSIRVIHYRYLPYPSWNLSCLVRKFVFFFILYFPYVIRWQIEIWTTTYRRFNTNPWYGILLSILFDDKQILSTIHNSHRPNISMCFFFLSSPHFRFFLYVSNSHVGNSSCETNTNIRTIYF